MKLETLKKRPQPAHNLHSHKLLTFKIISLCYRVSEAISCPILSENNNKDDDDDESMNVNDDDDNITMVAVLQYQTCWHSAQLQLSWPINPSCKSWSFSEMKVNFGTHCVPLLSTRMPTEKNFVEQIINVS